jgi:hypothetical protein
MRTLLLLVLSIVSIAAMAQTSLRGVVTDGNNAIPGAAVVVENTTVGAATDTNGCFAFTYDGKTPFALLVSCIGYESERVEVTDNAPLNIRLKAKSEDIDNVDVVAQRRGAGFETLDAKMALETASVSGGIESVVKSQMGVSTNSELSSQYRVRGGNFDENMVYVNGIEIYRPFLIRAGEQEGLSFVNPDLVSDLNFSSGGFDVSYGDKMSSVLDVNYKTPDRWAGSARASLLGASAHLEGLAFGGRLSHITGLRYKTNKYMVGSMDTKGAYDPQFFDVQSLWTIKVGDKLTFDLLGYYAKNRYRFQPQDRETTFGTISDAKKLKIYFAGGEDDNYRTGVVAASATLRSDTETQITLSASMYRSMEQECYDILGEYWLQQAESSATDEIVSESEGVGVGAYMEHARNELFGEIYTLSLRGNHRMQSHSVSWEVKGRKEHFNDYVDEWEYRDSAGYIAPPSTGVIDFARVTRGENDIKSNRLSAYVMDDYVRQVGDGRLTVSYGVRMSYWSGNEEWLVSPRASVRYAKDKWVYRIAGGLYHQSPFFREMRRNDGTMNTDIEAQHSWQIVGGADLYLKAADRPFKFTVEAYYKGLSNINPYSIDNVRIRYMADNCAKGYAAGVDVKVNGELVEGVESWASVSLMRSEEDLDNDNAGYIPRPADQRISFSMFLQDYLPSNRSVGAALSLYLSSGLPFGPPNGERWQATNRMPGYKRVDLGLFKDFGKRADGSTKYRNTQSLKLGVEVFNLFDFSNTISYFWVSDVKNRQYAVPNYLTARRLNVKLSVEF